MPSCKVTWTYHCLWNNLLDAPMERHKSAALIGASTVSVRQVAFGIGQWLPLEAIGYKNTKVDAFLMSNNSDPSLSDFLFSYVDDMLFFVDMSRRDAFEKLFAVL